MSDLLRQLASTSPWEATGALLGLAYLLLAVRRDLWCWLCAFVSTSIYLVLVARAGLYMQAALNVFYLIMAVYGYWQWRTGRDEQGEVRIVRWTWTKHGLAVGAVLAATVLNGWLLESRTQAVDPYLDSFVTWGSVLTTFMVARRVIENWLYWIVVDSAGAVLYFNQHLLVTALLFLIYVFIVIRGYFVWRASAPALGTAPG
ncbi:MAG: nicotinamide riboside transporter PnuC [Steroidobacteraceae bacterium]